jgi:hypothetical protein
LRQRRFTANVMDLAIPHRCGAFSAEESAAKADPDTERRESLP